MALNTFLLLPQEEDDICKIITDEISFNNIIGNVLCLLNFIRKDKGIKIYYDSKNIKIFLDMCDAFITGHYLENAKYKLENFLTRKSIDIQNKILRDGTCNYLLYTYNKYPVVNNNNTPEIIIVVVENIINYPDQKHLLINVVDHIESCRDVLLVIKDAKHIAGLPKFVRIPFVTEKGELELWLHTNDRAKFSLFNKNSFSRKKGAVVQGKPVFMENKTGYYWYMDNLHKDEYEVFNQNGEHVGTANLNGDFDQTKCIKGRKINL
ncbi:hypothetical protein LQZ19_02645 [Treponema primitia]|uniref:hypothetical protein n=1 Tax=Treponema primitia TaxID=88058 RepID=UPI00397F312C